MLVIFLLVICYGTTVTLANLSFDHCPTDSTLIDDGRMSGISLFYMKYENKFNEEVTYNRAVVKCKLCFDAHLLTKGIRSESVQAFLPTWIGVYKLAKTSDWKWSNGVTLSNDKWPAYTDAFHTDNVSPEINYGTIMGRTENNGTYWLPVPIDQSLYNQEFRNSVWSLYRNNEVIEKLNTIICERPRRPRCHYWNITDAYCTYAERYGCHKYVLTMMHDGDDAVGHGANCTRPGVRRVAVQCPDGHCVCNVTDWTEWSDCSAQTCSDGVGQRHRLRQHADQNCPKEHARFALRNAENCTVYGCEQLKDNGKMTEQHSLVDSFDNELIKH